MTVGCRVAMAAGGGTRQVESAEHTDKRRRRRASRDAPPPQRPASMRLALRPRAGVWLARRQRSQDKTGGGAADECHPSSSIIAAASERAGSHLARKVRLQLLAVIKRRNNMAAMLIECFQYQVFLI